MKTLCQAVLSSVIWKFSFLYLDIGEKIAMQVFKAGEPRMWEADFEGNARTIKSI